MKGTVKLGSKMAFGGNKVRIKPSTNLVHISKHAKQKQPKKSK